MQGEGGVRLQDDAREPPVAGGERRPLLRPGAHQEQCDDRRSKDHIMISELIFDLFCCNIAQNLAQNDKKPRVGEYLRNSI